MHDPVSRRNFLAGFGAMLGGSSAVRLAAQCTALNPAVAGCTVSLSRRFPIVTQDCPERCWAASIAGIFGYRGHRISQDVIAQTVFGSLACLPSGNTRVLDAVLSHDWTDASGDSFSASITGLYDPLNGIALINNLDLISELRNDHPMLYCNRSHAMVIVGMAFRQDVYGHLVVDQVTVADPYPGMGIHLLSPAEMVPAPAGGNMMYLASVDVD